MTKELTTTSYAILGQLALRPWHAYELTKEMRRNLHYFWPRAESRIYDEIKRLERAGLADVTASFQGRRRRMTYAITPTGRARLEAWLAAGLTSETTLESEGLLRVMGAESSEHVRAAVEAMRADAAVLHDYSVTVGREYVEGRHVFQERVRWRAHVHDFMASFAQMVEEWAERTEQMLDSWDAADADEVDRRATELIAEGVERLDSLRPAERSD